MCNETVRLGNIVVQCDVNGAHHIHAGFTGNLPVTWSVVEASNLESGMEIFLLGHTTIVENVTVFGPNNVIIHTTLGVVSVPSARWIKVLS